MMVFIFMLYLLLGIVCGSYSNTHLTINIDARDENCFYFPAGSGDQLMIQYHVVQKGDKAESLISFYLTTASGKIVASDLDSKLHSHTFTAEAAGDFKACFGNFITYSKKQVFFVVSVGGDQNATDWNNQDIVFEAIDTESHDVKLLDIDHSINQIRLRLHQSRQLQDYMRLLEAHDRSVAETNFEMVNTWSMVQMTVMVGVLAVQVLLVRNFFCDSVQPLDRLWRWK